MSRRIDISGKVFGKLVATKHVGYKYHNSGKRTEIWECLCECGNKKDVLKMNLLSGDSKSCGCMKNQGIPLDITGETYGQLTAIKNTGRQNNNGCYIWEFQCSCGTVLEREIGNLRHRRDSAKCESCISKQNIARLTTHGTSKNDKVYKAWCKIKERCFNPNDKSYPDYGAKGITMQESWRQDFTLFRDHIGEPPKDGKRYSVDRIDNYKGYEEGNLRWATDQQQSRNKRKKLKNTTGVTGVKYENKVWPCGKKSTPYYIAYWKNLDVSNGKKSFSIPKYGEELAFFMASEYREHQIMLLNLQGAGYSENHGK